MNNLIIKHDCEKYLMEKLRLVSYEYFSFKYFPKCFFFWKLPQNLVRTFLGVTGQYVLKLNQPKLPISVLSHRSDILDKVYAWGLGLYNQVLGLAYA